MINFASLRLCVSAFNLLLRQNLAKKWLCLILLMMSSCGYRFAGDGEQKTVTIPYVIGDVEGQLTNALIRQISSTSQFRYHPSHGQLILKVELIQDVNDKIGFRYQRKEDPKSADKNKIKKHLFPTENRRTLTAQVSLISSATDDIVYGPLTVSANADYDYIDEGSLYDLTYEIAPEEFIPILRFSEGQLDSIEGAQDDVLTPVYRRLAQNILSALFNELSN